MAKSLTGQMPIESAIMRSDTNVACEWLMHYPVKELVEYRTVTGDSILHLLCAHANVNAATWQTFRSYANAFWPIWKEARNNQGETCLFRYAERCFEDTAQSWKHIEANASMLENSSNPNAVFVAAKHSNWSFVEQCLSIASPAVLHSKYQGQSVLSLALEYTYLWSGRREFIPLVDTIVCHLAKVQPDVDSLLHYIGYYRQSKCTLSNSIVKYLFAVDSREKTALQYIIETGNAPLLMQIITMCPSYANKLLVECYDFLDETHLLQLVLVNCAPCESPEYVKALETSANRKWMDTVLTIVKQHSSHYVVEQFAQKFFEQLGMDQKLLEHFCMSCYPKSKIESAAHIFSLYCKNPSMVRDVLNKHPKLLSMVKSHATHLVATDFKQLIDYCKQDMIDIPLSVQLVPELLSTIISLGNRYLFDAYYHLYAEEFANLVLANCTTVSTMHFQMIMQLFHDGHLQASNSIYEYSMFHFLVQRDEQAAVESVLNQTNGAAATWKDQHGRVPLFYANSRQMATLLRMYSDTIGDIDNYGNNILSFSLMQKQKQSVFDLSYENWLLNEVPNPMQPNHESLHGYNKFEGLYVSFKKASFPCTFDMFMQVMDKLYQMKQ